jgi:hypothetical protein
MYGIGSSVVRWSVSMAELLYYIGIVVTGLLPVLLVSTVLFMG